MGKNRFFHLTLKYVFFFILVTVFFIKVSTACTIVTVISNNTILTGNNEDWQNPNTKIWFIPPGNGEFGRVCWGFDQAFGFAEGGMNDQGLFIDANAIDGDNQWIADLQKPDIPTLAGVDYILAKCSSVKEVIHLLSNYNFDLLKGGKFPVADAKGDGAVIEFYQGKLRVIKRTKRYQISTSVFQSSIISGNYNCERYQSAEKVLTSIDRITVDSVRRVLSTTASEFFFPTVYSTICNLKEKKIYLYNFHNFEDAVIFDLSEELTKGRHAVDIPSLFPVKSFGNYLFDKYRILSGKEELYKIIQHKGIKAAIKQYYIFKNNQFRKIRRIDIREPELNDLGNLLLEKGMVKAALEIIKLTITEYPNSTDAFFWLGIAYLKIGNINQAVEAFKKSLILDPNNKKAIDQLKKLEINKK